MISLIVIFGIFVLAVAIKPDRSIFMATLKNFRDFVSCSRIAMTILDRMKGFDLQLCLRIQSIFIALVGAVSRPLGYLLRDDNKSACFFVLVFAER